MKPETAFDTGLPAYSVHQLSIEDIGAIQALFDKCLDYMLLVDGRSADPDTVKEEFQWVPTGKLLEDKFVFGIIDPLNGLVGLLDTMRG